MNCQAIINAINTKNDLEAIARDAGITREHLRGYLINMIRQSIDDGNNSDDTVIHEDDSNEESGDAAMSDDMELKESIVVRSGEEYDSDDDSDDDEEYERIIRNAPVKFSREQLEFLNFAVRERKNMLLTASAGYGKSSVISTTVKLLQHLVKPHPLSFFRSRYGTHPSVGLLIDCPTYGLCASTGKAASLIGGRTLHSYLGIGLGRGSVEEWFARLKTAKYLKDTFLNLRAVQIIIIDEISMISAELLDKISAYLQLIKRNTDPFGGVQMILIADFAQLSPVVGRYAFKSGEYLAANIQVHRLTKCFRQSDPVFLNILNEIRYGNCSDESFKILKEQTSIDEEYSQGLKPLRLLATNAEVDKVNEQELNKVCSENNCQPMSFPVKVMPGQLKKSESCRKTDGIPDEVKLVVGAQVVVTYNLCPTIVNGSQGSIVSMNANEVVVSIVGGKEATIRYIPYKSPDDPNIFDAAVVFHFLPLKLGWASTVHKAQGMSISLLEVDLSKVFCSAQAYTAISRVRSLRGLIIKGLSKRAFICDPVVKRFYGVE